MDARLGFRPSVIWRSLFSVRVIIFEPSVYVSNLNLYQWTSSASGHFTVKSAYIFLAEEKKRDLANTRMGAVGHHSHERLLDSPLEDAYSPEDQSSDERLFGLQGL